MKEEHAALVVEALMTQAPIPLSCGCCFIHPAELLMDGRKQLTWVLQGVCCHARTLRRLYWKPGSCYAITDPRLDDVFRVYDRKLRRKQFRRSNEETNRESQ